MFYKRTKHVDIWWHFIRHHQVEGAVKISYMATAAQAADGLTKVLTAEKHNEFMNLLGLVRKPCPGRG